VSDSEIILDTVRHLAKTPYHEPVSPELTVMLRTMFSDLDRWTAALIEMRKKLESDGG
jgi:hypothetical protein